MDQTKKILIISIDDKLKDVLNFCFDGWGYDVHLYAILKAKPHLSDIEAIKKISPDVIIIDVQSARKEQLDICRMLKNDITTSFTPIITLINKRQLRNQLLNLKEGVDDYLIKPPDPLDLRVRIEIALKRSYHTIHASSLTALPGGKILEEVLTEKVKAREAFTFAYLDIDNFKCFNDVYGYQKGDRVILQTAHILYAIVKRFGNNNDFISHIGGDDFAFITNPDKYEAICREFINIFDRITPFHYSKGDRQKGYVVARDRSRKVRKVPLMSISIAVINQDATLSFKNTIAINERVVELKKYLKTIPGSKFMADRRDAKIFGHTTPQISKKKQEAENYLPLGQILLDRNVISHEQLDEALLIHWKKGIHLGEVLKELGVLVDQELNRALNIQTKALSHSTLGDYN